MIFSAKRLWSGGNFFNFIAQPLASMSSSVSGRLKYSVASPTSCSVETGRPFLFLETGSAVRVEEGSVVWEAGSDCETSDNSGCNKK